MREKSKRERELEREMKEKVREREGRERERERERGERGERYTETDKQSARDIQWLQLIKSKAIYWLMTGLDYIYMICRLWPI